MIAGSHTRRGLPIGESGDPLAMLPLDLYTVSAKSTGCRHFPISCDEVRAGFPIGLQLQAPPLEKNACSARPHVQGATDWHRRRPTLPAV